MNKWERFIFGGLVSNFTGRLEAPARRKEDMVTDELVKKVAGNGESTKELVARNYLENKVSHARIDTILGFHSKFIWTCIGILITGFIGGGIALICRVIFTGG